MLAHPKTYIPFALLVWSAATVNAQTIPSGTTIAVRTIDAIESKNSDPGKTFAASLNEAVTAGGATIAPKGARALLKVLEVKEAGKLKGKSELTIALTGIEVDSKIIAVETASVTEGSAGKGKSSAKKAAIGGALGALVGGVAGGGKGAAAGAAIGAGGGAAVSMATKGPSVKIPSETVLSFVTR